MFDSNVSLTQVLIGLEGTLCIEYSESLRVDEVLKDAIIRLEEKYGTTFDKDVYSLQEENQLSADKINQFLLNIKGGLEELAFFVSLKLYHKNLPITLAEVNYIGYSRQQLLVSLRYLQDVDEYKKHGKEIIVPLTNQLNNITACTVKRLFVVLLMLDKLGIVEGVSIVAQLLYLGGLTV